MHLAPVFLLLAVFLPSSALAAITFYDNLPDWKAAVGAHQLEDFESYPETPLPIDGGQVPLDHFVVENDDQGDNEWSGGSGLWIGSHFDPEIPDTMNLIVSVETCCDETAGPTYIDAVFPQPIYSYALEYSWFEDYEYPAFQGFVLDEPITRFSLVDPFSCDHSWCAIEAIRWAAVPEPSTGLLVAMVSILLALGRRCQVSRTRAMTSSDESVRSSWRG